MQSRHPAGAHSGKGLRWVAAGFRPGRRGAAPAPPVAAPAPAGPAAARRGRGRAPGSAVRAPRPRRPRACDRRLPVRQALPRARIDLFGANLFDRAVTVPGDGLGVGALPAERWSAVIITGTPQTPAFSPRPRKRARLAAESSCSTSEVEAAADGSGGSLHREPSPRPPLPPYRRARS
jgi:hypothetical protein